MVWIAGQTATTVLGGITISNIPQTYTHLQLRIVARGNDAGSIAYMNVGVNSDFYSTNYAQHALLGNGSSAASEGSANIGGVAGLYAPGGSVTANTFSSTIVDLLDYTNTSKFKTFRNLHGWDANGSGFIVLNSGLWKNTAAVTSITAFNINFAVGSRVDLYGITTSSVTGA